MAGTAGTAEAAGARKLLTIQTQHRRPTRRLLAWDTLVTEQWMETWEDNGPEEFNPGFYSRHLLQTVRPAARLRLQAPMCRSGCKLRLSMVLPPAPAMASSLGPPPTDAPSCRARGLAVVCKVLADCQTPDIDSVLQSDNVTVPGVAGSGQLVVTSTGVSNSSSVLLGSQAADRVSSVCHPPWPLTEHALICWDAL